MAIFQCVTALFLLVTPNMQRAAHLAFALVLMALIYPIKLKNKTAFTVVNISSIVFTILVGVFAISRSSSAYLQHFALNGPSQFDLIFGTLLVFWVIEGARRVSGIPMPLLALLFLIYALWGGSLPSILGHRGYSWNLIIEQMAFTEEGIYGTPLGVSSTFVAMFILFGAFLAATGAGKWFIDIAFALTGTTRSGPALTAVVSSAAMGTMSGSGVANVVTTGAFTIPLMKSCGYNATFAGAVEAAASTGGQIMPPVMGAAAFILAEMMGRPYAEVAIAAIIPAILYFVGCGAQVHFEACKHGFKGLSHNELPPLKKTFLSGIVFLVPIAVLIWSLCVRRTSASMSAIYAIVSLIVVSMLLRKKGERISISDVANAFEDGAKELVPIAMACATAGLIIGVLMRTGLSMKFSTLLIDLSGGSMLLALFLTMICCVILGMGLPTSAAFIVTAALGAPALIRLDIHPMAAYMFVFYFASVSAITPPVAMAAYAAAGIAKANPLKTGFMATRLGIAGFIIPYFFCYNEALLMIGAPLEIIQTSATSLIGVFFLAGALEGYFFFTDINIFERLLLVASALLLVDPNWVTDVIGVGFAVAALIPMYLRFRKKKGINVS